jgi:AcrR family transcriptional regulator
MARKYDGSRRAEAARRTREQIVAAAFRLHGEGILDLETLAREADVSLPTVRKHFPTRESLFQNCTAYGLHLVAMPDLDEIREESDPADRTELAVRQVYSMHESLFGQMWVAFLLENESPTMANVVRQYESLTSQVADAVLEGWPIEEPRLSLARGPAIAMLSPLTYRALRVHGGLSPEEAVEQTATMLAGCLGMAASRKEASYP